MGTFYTRKPQRPREASSSHHRPGSEAATQPALTCGGPEATAHKLARCAFAVLRDGTPYRDLATDYEALLVTRNAPRSSCNPPVVSGMVRLRHRVLSQQTSVRRWTTPRRMETMRLSTRLTAVRPSLRAAAAALIVSAMVLAGGPAFGCFRN